MDEQLRLREEEEVAQPLQRVRVRRGIVRRGRPVLARRLSGARALALHPSGRRAAVTVAGRGGDPVDVESHARGETLYGAGTPSAVHRSDARASCVIARPITAGRSCSRTGARRGAERGDADKDGSYKHLFNEDLIKLGLARTITFSHAYRRKFGGDHIDDVREAVRAYEERIGWSRR